MSHQTNGRYYKDSTTDVFTSKRGQTQQYIEPAMHDAVKVEVRVGRDEEERKGETVDRGEESRKEDSVIRHLTPWAKDEQPEDITVLPQATHPT